MNPFIHFWLAKLQTAIPMTDFGTVRSRRRHRGMVIAAAEVVEHRLQLSAVAGLILAEATTHAATETLKTISVGVGSTNVNSHLNSDPIDGKSLAAISSQVHIVHITHVVTESGPKDIAEDFTELHMHLPRGTTPPSHSHTVSANDSATLTGIQTVLASLSSSQSGVQTANQRDNRLVISTTNSAIVTAAADASKHEQRDNDGLIDIGDPVTPKTPKRPAVGINPPETSTTEESSGTPSEAVVIAARSATTTRENRARTGRPRQAVPAMFATTGDGGFIELVANTANQGSTTPVGQPRPKHLTRYDQVEAEIGRFVAFDQTNVLASSALAIVRPRKVTAADAAEEIKSNDTNSTHQLSWGLVLSASAAVALWRPRVYANKFAQTIVRTVRMRCRRVAKLCATRCLPRQRPS